MEQTANKYHFLMGHRTLPIARKKETETEKHITAFGQYLLSANRDFNERWIVPDLRQSMNLENFHLFRTLGIGGFGRVVLAMLRNSDSNFYYAIKIIDKQDIIKKKWMDHAIQELRILDAVRFPFLIHLIHYFKSNCYIFAVLPFVSGGEMFTLLSEEKKFDEAQAKFFAAQVIFALEYLHSNGVIYRDLKPENILIDGDGYLKLIDFGFCKKIDDNRTWTLCGTPEYLAPEIILSLGYSYSVDFWTLGILIFEMVAGRPPFYASNPMKLYELIINCKYSMPDTFSIQLKHLIQNLLQPNRHRRYGVLKRGIGDIKLQEWFTELDWNAIFTRTLRPIYIPKQFQSIKDVIAFHVSKEICMRQNVRDEYPQEFQHIRIRQKN